MRLSLQECGGWGLVRIPRDKSKDPCRVRVHGVSEGAGSWNWRDPGLSKSVPHFFCLTKRGRGGLLWATDSFHAHLAVF